MMRADDNHAQENVEAALRETAERLRFALETSQAGAWDLNLADHKVFRSLEHDRIFGYPELLPEWTYEMFLEHVLPEDRALVDGKFRRAVEGKSDWNFECRIRRADGKTRWIWAAGRHRQATANSERHLAGVVQDITDRKLAEESLRQSEDRFQLMAATIQDVLYRVDGATGEFEYVSPAFERLLGYSLADVAAMGGREKFLEQVVERGGFAPQREIYQALQAGSLTPASTLWEAWWRCKHGELLCFEDRWIPYYAENKLAGTFGVLRDITGRKRTEERIGRLDRAKAILDGVDRAIAHLGDQRKLLEEVCRVVVRQGGFQLAWFGMISADGTVQPVAQAGETGYLEGMRSWPTPNDPEYCGPVGTAIRENRPVVVGDIAQDIRMAPWRDLALKFGLRYAAVFPLRIAGQVTGSFHVYAPQAGFFNEGEIGLLNQVSTDVSCALTATVNVAARKQAEEQLRKLSRAVEQNPASVVITDLTGAIEYVNPKFTRVTGYKADEVRGKNPRMLKSGELSAKEYQRLWRTISQGREWRGEFHNRKKNGELFWEAASISPIKNEEGSITHFVAVKEDITERKLAEMALQESEQRFRQLTDATFEGICFSENGRICDVNDQFLQMFGYDRDELVGKEIAVTGAPASRAMMAEAIQIGTEEIREHQLQRKDGSVFQAEAQAKLVRVGNRRLRVTALRDITGRKQAAKALRQSQERYVLAERAVNDGLWDWNLLTDEDYFSPRWKEILGYREDELPNQKSAFLNSVHPDDRAAVDAITWQHLELGRRYALEFRLRHKDGSYRWVFSRGAAQRDAAGRAYRVVGAITDITERKAVEAALRESEEQYFNLFEQMVGGFVLLEVICDRDGKPVDHRLLRANSEFEKMTGLKRSEEIGRTSDQLSFKWPAEVAQRYYQVALEGTRQQYERFNESLQRYYDIHVYSPRKGQFAMVFYDITARKRAEDSGREHEQRFQQLANTITDVFWIASPDLHRVLYVSPGYGRVWGRTAESLYADPRQWIAAISAEDRDRVMGYFANLSERDSELGIEYRIVRPDGSLRWILDRGFQVRDAAGKLIRLTGVASDITERKRLEEKVVVERERLEGELLRRLEREQERIGRDLHDGLCQILVGAKYRVGVLEKMIAGENRSAAADMAIAIEGMINDTIQQARNLARGLNPVQLAANGLALALETLAKDIEAGGIAHCSFRLEAARIVADRNIANHLYRITQEAVQNAIKHGKARKISIVLRKLAGRLILRVGDDGVGFSTKPESSDGAGLHNMRTRTAMIGGVLAIRPGLPGGTVITVSLPASESPG